MARRIARKVKRPISDTRIAECRDTVQTLLANGLGSFSEARVYCEAALQPEATVGSIVKSLQMPFSTVSRVVFNLVERGLLCFEPHPSDRRSKLVRANA